MILHKQVSGLRCKLRVAACHQSMVSRWSSRGRNCNAQGSCPSHLQLREKGGILQPVVVHVTGVTAPLRVSHDQAGMTTSNVMHFSSETYCTWSDHIFQHSLTTLWLCCIACSQSSQWQTPGPPAPCRAKTWCVGTPPPPPPPGGRPTLGMLKMCPVPEQLKHSRCRP